MQELLVKLNSLYSELEEETDDKTIKQIKREIRKIEKELNEKQN